MDYLRYKNSKGTVKPKKFKTKAIAEFKMPRNIHEISFLIWTGISDNWLSLTIQTMSWKKNDRLRQKINYSVDLSKL